jgi:hypothetical protein
METLTGLPAGMKWRRCTNMGARGAALRNCAPPSAGVHRREPDGRGLCLALSRRRAAFTSTPHLWDRYFSLVGLQPACLRFWQPDKASGPNSRTSTLDYFDIKPTKEAKPSEPLDVSCNERVS